MSPYPIFRLNYFPSTQIIAEYVTNDVVTGTAAGPVAITGTAGTANTTSTVALNILPNYVATSKSIRFSYKRGDTWVVIATLAQAGKPAGVVVGNTVWAVSDLGGTKNFMNWATAMGIEDRYNSTLWSNHQTVPTQTTGCAAYWETNTSDPSTGLGCWRLPTANETVDAMRSGVIPNITPQEYTYWTATELSGNHVYIFNANGQLMVSAKTNPGVVRCVRPLDQ